MDVSASSGPDKSLAYLSATPGQRRAVLVVAALQLLAAAIVAPIATTPLPRLDAFIPTVQGIIFVNDFITSLLLFAQYSIIQSRALLVLASGYLFTALIVIPHALTFPGAFSQTGLLNAGLQSTVWLYTIWHIVTPASVLVYSIMKDDKAPTRETHSLNAPTICSSVLLVVCLVGASVWLVTAGDNFLPAIFADGTRAISARLTALTMVTVLLSAAALVMLWVRRRSLLDYWLILVVLALISELCLTAVFNSTRFTLGFYAGRAFSLATSVFVLGLLLSEVTRLYVSLARSNRILERESSNKLMNLEALTESIAHEVRQPLTAIVANGSAALQFVDRSPPDLEEVRLALIDIIQDGARVEQVLVDIRVLFGRSRRDKQPIDINHMISEALRLLQETLSVQGVASHVELEANLPLVDGHQGQLQEVLINLVQNAVDAMGSVANSRVLTMRTLRRGSDIVVEVEDTGPGVDPLRSNKVFDAFVTTKPRGTGLGLTICRMIIEQHSGSISALSDRQTGAVFQVVLPVKNKDQLTARGK